jgi:hypothetical protein
MTSRKGETYSYCKICCIEIVVAHGGKGDLPKHVKSNELSEANKDNRLTCSVLYDENFKKS